MDRIVFKNGFCREATPFVPAADKKNIHDAFCFNEFNERQMSYVFLVLLSTQACGPFRAGARARDFILTGLKKAFSHQCGHNGDIQHRR